MLAEFFNTLQPWCVRALRVWSSPHTLLGGRTASFLKWFAGALLLTRNGKFPEKILQLKQKISRSPFGKEEETFRRPVTWYSA